MKDEREELVKRVFPRLRRVCEERGVTWGAVDIRWGITDEQQEKGEVVSICLREIDECRPFFIGILGERYGWVPDSIPEGLLEQQPWLAKCRGCSVTELEILHGALNNPEKADHAYFYFRDKAYIETLPELKRIGLTENTSLPGDGPDSRIEKLASLKDRIRNSGLKLCENYTSPKHLGELVLKDFTDLIDRLFPKGEEPGLLQREAAEHEAFAQSRCKVYIGRDEYFSRLDTHAKVSGPPLVITGESGTGKSALLSNWAFKYREKHPDDLLVMHFIGATPYSADWASMLTRIMGELRERFDIQDEIPGTPQGLRQAFARWLYLAAAKGRVVLILDALNQLEDRDNAPALEWLPPYIPENVRLIVSSLPGRPFDELTKRGWPKLEIKPLREDERKQLTRDFLGRHRKTLSEDRVERIASNEQTGNPLFLRALLEELRVFGTHHHLDRAIEHYLSSKTIPELYGKILRRLEQDYEREWPGLVEDAATFIWASRRGLSEDELLDILGVGESALPYGQWLQFSAAIEELLVSRSGLINFTHNYIREAILTRYLPTERSREAAHERLADYFSGKEISPRKIDEMPWQLYKAKSWQRLYDLLADLDFFHAVWQENRFEVVRYWSKVTSSSQLRLVGAYQPAIEKPQEVANKDALVSVAGLLVETHHISELSPLNQFLTTYFRKCGDYEKLSGSLRSQARMLYKRGDLNKAIEVLEEAEQISREHGDQLGLSKALVNQALLHYTCGNLDKAMKIFEVEEKHCREFGYMDGLYRCLGNQALILKKMGDLDGALALHTEVERICRSIGDPDGLSRSLVNHALILKRLNDLDGALRLLKERERICRDLGDPDGLQRSIGNQAAIMVARGELDSAANLAKEQENICRKIGNPEGLSHSLAYQAEVLSRKGQIKEALQLAEEAYALAVKHGYGPMVEEISPILENIRSQLD